MSAEPALYTIRVGGRLGATALSALSAFPALAAEHEMTQTVLSGFLDSSALYGVLSQLEMLGLDLIEISRTTPPCLSPDDDGSEDGGPTQV